MSIGGNLTLPFLTATGEVCVCVCMFIYVCMSMSLVCVHVGAFVRTCVCDCGVFSKNTNGLIIKVKYLKSRYQMVKQ